MTDSKKAAPAYRNPNWKTDNTELEAALDAFWNVAYQQGQEQRGHDDEEGTAQKAEDDLRGAISAIRAQAVEDVLSALTAHELYQYRPKSFKGFIGYARTTLLEAP